MRAIVFVSSATLLVVASFFWLRAAAQPPLLDPGSNPLAVLAEAFHDSGYQSQDAANLATRAIKRIRGEVVDPFVPKQEIREGAVPLHPNSNPHALLMEAFIRGGHTAHDASNIASWIALRLRGANITLEEMAMQTGVEECFSHSLSFVYCEGGQKKRKLLLVNAMCWGEMEKCWIAAPECPQGESRWATLAATCIEGISLWVSDRDSEPTWVPCSHLDIADRECLGEIDCQTLHVQCCHLLNGCGGTTDCPDCG
jgi:hypothetical protein